MSEPKVIWFVYNDNNLDWVSYFELVRKVSSITKKGDVLITEDGAFRKV